MANTSRHKEGTVDTAGKKSELLDEEGNLYVVVVCRDAFVIRLLS